jgi:hypothetical protein
MTTAHRSRYEAVTAALAEHGWSHGYAPLCDYHSYTRGREHLNIRFGYYPTGIRPTWAEVQRPRVVGETTGVPEYWTGRMPAWVTLPLPRKGLQETLLATIAAPETTGPFQDDIDDEESY